MDKHEMKRRIEGLQELQCREVFKIILSHSEKYTTNSNGIFVNISLLNPMTLGEIAKYLDYCIQSDIYINRHEAHEKQMKLGIYAQTSAPVRACQNI
jgi:hypothetical protein